MLVLSRKLGESITINGNIVVHVQALSRGRVALSIDAPREVSVVRSEIVEAEKQRSEPEPPASVLELVE